MNDGSIRRATDAVEYLSAEGCYIQELSNSLDDDAASIARARVAPGVTTRWHRLSGTTERYVIVSGCGSVELGELPPQPVQKGDVVIIPPSLAQRITNTGTTDLIFLAICTPRFEWVAYEDIEALRIPPPT